MGERSQNLRLSDIADAIELIDSEMSGITLQAFAADTRKRWLVERGIEIISEASRHLDAAVKQRDIGDIIRHDYERVAYDVLWRVVRDDLPTLLQACRAELDANPDR